MLHFSFYLSSFYKFHIPVTRTAFTKTARTAQKSIWFFILASLLLKNWSHKVRTKVCDLHVYKWWCFCFLKITCQATNKLKTITTAVEGWNFKDHSGKKEYDSYLKYLLLEHSQKVKISCNHFLFCIYATEMHKLEKKKKQYIIKKTNHNIKSGAH